MTCLKYGQCHYWFNLNRPLVIVPCCGLPWMLKWLTWLKNSGEEDKPSLLYWKKDHMQNRSGRYKRQTQHLQHYTIDFLNFFKPLYAVHPVLPHSVDLASLWLQSWNEPLWRWVAPALTPFFSHLFFLHQPEPGQVRETCLVSTINHNNKLSES